jgi:creatinine amidohydrolase
MKAAKTAQKNNGTILQLSELTWKQLDKLNRTTTIIFIPLSPLEEHGPHLPIGTDLLTTQDATKEAMKLIQKKKPEFTPLLHPTIPLGHTGMAQGFPGTISVSVKTIRTIVVDTVSALADQGFHYFVISTFHMDLGHLKGIYTAMTRLKKTYPIDIIEPWGPYFYNQEVEHREPKANFDTHLEIHGCYRETSMMLYQYPYLVDPVYKTLPPVVYDVYSPKALGKTFKTVGATEGYIGSPAHATSDYGRWYFQEIVETIATATIEMLEGRPTTDLPAKTKMAMRSMFWL